MRESVVAAAGCTRGYRVVRCGLKLHFRCFVGIRRGGFEGRAYRQIAVHHGVPQTARKGADLGVVSLYGLDKVTARHSDTVLGAFKLRLQGQEVLVANNLLSVRKDVKQKGESAETIAKRAMKVDLQALATGSKDMLKQFDGIFKKK